MEFKSVYHDLKITVEEIAVGANEIFTGVGVDTAGYEGVAFVLAVGDYEAGEYVMKAQQDTVSTYATVADLAGTAQTFTSVTATNTNVRVLDISHPTERFVRPIVTIPNLTATTQPASIISIRYGGRIRPESNDGEYHVSPAEGTA